VHFDAFEAIHAEVSKMYFLHERESLAAKSRMPQNIFSVLYPKNNNGYCFGIFRNGCPEKECQDPISRRRATGDKNTVSAETRFSICHILKEN